MKSERLRWALAVAMILLITLVVCDRTLRQPPAAAPPAASPVGISAAERAPARVTTATDGDTVRLENGERVRYLGIDTPELGSDKITAHAFAAPAAERNRQLVAGKSVLLEGDAEDRDRFGRLLRHVWLDDELVAATLLREGLGYAQLLPPNSKHRDRFEAAEQEARATRRGLWSDWPTPAPVFLTPVRPSLLPFNNPRPPDCPADVPVAQDAARLVGQAATVCLRDVRVQKGRATFFLRPRQSPPGTLTLVLLEEIWSQLPTNPERHFEQRTVIARGRVELYEGAPELVVRSLDDLRVIQ